MLHLPLIALNSPDRPTAAKNHKLKISCKASSGDDVDWDLEVWDTAGQAIQHLNGRTE